MLITTNITTIREDLERFSHKEDLQNFYKSRGLDGLELLPCSGEQIPEMLPREDIYGLHLSFYPAWMDFWLDNRQALDEEFGERTLWQEYYGENREAFLDKWRRELSMAKKMGVRYVVFHVSESTLQECITYRFVYPDREIIRQACSIINELLDGQDYDFYFLVENLWWSGFNLQDPAMTRLLLEGIHYPKKGIMLDTGHLLSTNRKLKTQQEGVRYIESVLQAHGELCRYIKGVHLNQSLSGAYAERMIADPPVLTGTYWERMGQVYSHILHIDYHHPFLTPEVKDLMERIGPEFITIELITSSRQEHEKGLEAQMQILFPHGRQ